jgi:hypothetical protein
MDEIRQGDNGDVREDILLEYGEVGQSGLCSCQLHGKTTPRNLILVFKSTRM